MLKRILIAAAAILALGIAGITLYVLAVFHVFGGTDSRIAAGCSGPKIVHDSSAVEAEELRAMSIALKRGISQFQLSGWQSVSIAGPKARVRRDGQFQIPNQGETQALMAEWKAIYRKSHPRDENPVVSVIIVRPNGDELPIESEQCPVYP